MEVGGWGGGWQGFVNFHFNMNIQKEGSRKWDYDDGISSIFFPESFW